MIPVSLVTGFLGSGKTTLIGRLLREPALAGTLVIVNEFGEVGIDHDLLEASSDDTILLANGCLCCTIRGNLVDTLLDVQAQRDEGRLRDFDRVVVETSGVVDPGPVLGFVFGDPRVAALYRPGAVIATCDAVSGPETLDRQPEAVAQATLADRLLVTKSDLVPPGAVQALVARLRQLNPVAPILVAVQGEGIGTDVLDMAEAARGAASCQPGCDDPAHHHHHHHGQAEAGHGGRFRPQLLLADRPLQPTEAPALAAAIRQAATPGLLRLKGILPLAEGGGAAIIQAAPGVVHPPAIVDGPAQGQGRVMLITEGPAAAPLLAALARFGIRPAPRLPDPSPH